MRMNDQLNTPVEIPQESLESLRKIGESLSKIGDSDTLKEIASLCSRLVEIPQETQEGLSKALRFFQSEKGMAFMRQARARYRMEKRREKRQKANLGFSIHRRRCVNPRAPRVRSLHAHVHTQHHHDDGGGGDDGPGQSDPDKPRVTLSSVLAILILSQSHNLIRPSRAFRAGGFDVFKTRPIGPMLVSAHGCMAPPPPLRYMRQGEIRILF